MTKCKYAESKGKELQIKNKNITYLEDWGAPQKLDKNLIIILLYFEFGILLDSFLI